MALSMDEKRSVLANQDCCKRCAGVSHTDTCHDSWKIRKATMVRCHGARDDTNQRCTSAWYMCDDHKDKNKKSVEHYRRRWKKPMPEDKVHTNATLHFMHEEKVEADHDISVDLDLPEVPNIQRVLTNNDEDSVVQTKGKPKLLYVYQAMSNVGECIKVIADTGATIALATERDLDKLGERTEAGTTRINGVGNKPIEEANMFKVSLKSDFANIKRSSKFEVAILPTITHVNEADHTKPINEALMAMERRCPAFMARHKDYFNINNFQVHRPGGDVSLLLSNAENSLHPKVLVQFRDGPAIALIRQTTPENKFLILAGRTKTAKALENTDVEIDKESVEQANHFRHEETPEDKDRIQHVFCCVLNNHDHYQQINQEERQDQAEDMIGGEEQRMDLRPRTQDNEGNNTITKQQANAEKEANPDIVKKVLEVGHGKETPKPGDKAVCHYISKTKDQKVLDNTYTRGKPYAFTV